MSADYLRLVEQRLGRKFNWVVKESWAEIFGRLRLIPHSSARYWSICVLMPGTLVPESVGLLLKHKTVL